MFFGPCKGCKEGRNLAHGVPTLHLQGLDVEAREPLCFLHSFARQCALS